MPALQLPFDPTKLPAAGRPERADIGIERFSERASGDAEQSAFAATLIKDPDGRRLLDALFGNSGFLGQCLLHEIGFLQALLKQGPDAAFRDILLALKNLVVTIPALLCFPRKRKMGAWSGRSQEMR